MASESAGGAAPHLARSKRASRIVVLVVAIALLIAPAFVLQPTPLAAGTELVFVGMIPTLVALLHGRRAAATTAIGTAALVALVELANPIPAAAGVLMLAVGLGIGALALGGWQSIAAVAASWPAVLLVSAPIRFDNPGWVSPSWSAVIIPALLTLGGALWTIVIGIVFLRGLPVSRPDPLDRRVAAIYGVALGAVLGITAFAATAWWHGTSAGWVLLTILVIARPGIHETRRRIVARSVGTIAGGLVAAGLDIVVPVQSVLSIAGLIALVAAIALQLTKANYAIYAFALTAAIVLLNSHGVDVFAVDLQRVVFTVVGALLAAVVVTVLELVFRSRTAAVSSQSSASTGS